MMLVLSAIEVRADPVSLSAPTSLSANNQRAADLWDASITEAARRFDIPERWIRAIIGVESHGDVRAVSPKGALGLMQIMPATWDELRARHGLGNDPFDPRDNIIAGAAYLREMRDRYGMPGALAAYNAGPARYEEHRLLGVPLPGETRAYLDKLSPIVGNASPRLFAGSTTGATGGSESSLFAIDTRTKPDPNRPASRLSRDELFATVGARRQQAEPADGESPDVQTD